MSTETINSDISIEEIRAEAFRLYCASHYEKGRDLQNWLEAKKILLNANAATTIHFPPSAKLNPSNTPNPFPRPDSDTSSTT